MSPTVTSRLLVNLIQSFHDGHLFERNALGLPHILPHQESCEHEGDVPVESGQQNIAGTVIAKILLQI